MIQIEDASPRDFLAIAALDRVAWLHTGEPFIADGEHVWRVWCQYATVFVARREAKTTDGATDDPQGVVGALVMFPTSGGEMFLHKIMVHPGGRGRGIGGQLMQTALQRAGANVLLTVDPENQRAVRLYESVGFVVRERVEGYYREHEHRLVMVRAASRDSED